MTANLEPEIKLKPLNNIGISNSGASARVRGHAAPGARVSIDIRPPDGLETGRPGRNPLAGLIPFAAFGSNFGLSSRPFEASGLSHEGP